MKKATTIFGLLVAVLFTVIGCGGEEFSDTPVPDSGDGTAGNSGSGGTGGSSGSAGQAGSAGDGGSAGHAGTGGVSGSGGEAGDAGPDATGGMAGSSGTGGDAGFAGTSGSGGDAGPEADAPDPCTVPATANEIADMLGVDCALNFGAKCGTNQEIKRSEFIVAVVSQVPSNQFEGYEYSASNLPTTPPYTDVPLTYSALLQIDQAKWLNIILSSKQGQKVITFFPDDPALHCWTEEVADRAQNLPTVYLVGDYYAPDQTISAGPITVIRYHVYGVTSTNPLNQTIRVTNNLQGKFDTPQDTSALSKVGFVGDNGIPVSQDLVNGEATFANMGYHPSVSGVFTIQLQVYPDADAHFADARVGIDPTSIPVRGGQDGAPTITIP